MTEYTVSRMLNSYNQVQIKHDTIEFHNFGVDKQRLRFNQIEYINLKNNTIFSELIINTYSSRYNIRTRKQKAMQIYNDIQKMKNTLLDK